jgi:hypothetical protein
MTGFADRLGRALKLDASLYEEVEHDNNALIQALLLVALSSLCAGIGAGTVAGLSGLFWNILYAFGGWICWAWSIYLAGLALRTPETRTDMGELLRVIGFASAPGIFRILAVFGVLPGVIWAAVAVWMLGAMIIAVRQALDFLSTGRAIAVCVLGLVVQMLIVGLMTRIVEVLFPGRL